MPKARLVFDGDNIYTEKDARIYKLKSDISTKIDGIPWVVDSLDSTSATDALSANMGRTLQDQINSMSWTGKFLSTWDATTWLPGTNPQEDPYTYKVWDYYVVSAVWATNYKPHWGTYTQWVPSTTVETENVWINDKYYFDWADWVRIPDTSIQISIDSALSTTSTNAVENRAIANAVNAKQDVISDLSTIRTWAGKWATALQPNDNISQLTNNVGYQTAGDVAAAIAWKQDILSAWDWISITSNTVTNTKPWAAVSNTAPANPTEWLLWYDTVNDVLKSYDWSNWNEVGSDAADINTKTFYLASSSDLTSAQAAYDWYVAGNNPIIVYDDKSYTLSTITAGGITFESIEVLWDVISNEHTRVGRKTIVLSVTSWSVTSISTQWRTTIANVLATNQDYSSPYIPQYNGSPATKKYVDDSVADVIPSWSTAPANPQEWDLWYDTVNHVLKIYNWTSWETVDTNTAYTAWNGINIDANNEISIDTTVVATQNDLAWKQDTLVSWTNIKTINNQSILGSGDLDVWSDIVYATQADYEALLPWALTDNKHYIIYRDNWGGGSWEPNVNTLAYYPLNSTYTYTDQSWNQNDLVPNGTWTYTYDSISWENTSRNYFQTTNSIWFANGDSFYFWVWMCVTGTETSWSQTNGARLFAPPTRWYYISLAWQPWALSWADFNIADTWGEWTTPVAYNISREEWYYIYYTWTVWQASGVWGIISPDWVNHTSPLITPVVINSWIITIWRNWNSGYNDWYYMWKLSNVIIEDKIWTTQDILNYYNQTKSLYWL